MPESPVSSALGGSDASTHPYTVQSAPFVSATISSPSESSRMISGMPAFFTSSEPEMAGFLCRAKESMEGWLAIFVAAFLLGLRPPAFVLTGRDDVLGLIKVDLEGPVEEAEVEDTPAKR